jgi:ATP-binding cassette subfamily C (CFTR/MRP) protein 4
LLLKTGKQPPKSWPHGGQIQFEKLSLSYVDKDDDDEDEDVLKCLSFDIRSEEKIGIVGRTGAGKSSIISALFRLREPRSGSIFIDGVRINDIGLHDLRRSISIIPQDPVLFSGTIRYNLDPFDQFGDEELWAIIQEV